MKQNTKTLSALLLALVLSLSLILPVSAAESGTALDDAARATVNSAMTYGQATQASWAVWQDGKSSPPAPRLPRRTAAPSR